MIRKYVNLRTFFNPENWLADKNELFPCLPNPKNISRKIGPTAIKYWEKNSS